MSRFDKHLLSSTRHPMGRQFVEETRAIVNGYAEKDAERKRMLEIAQAAREGKVLPTKRMLKDFPLARDSSLKKLMRLTRRGVLPVFHVTKEQKERHR